MIESMKDVIRARLKLFYVKRIVLAESYEIKGLRHRHRTPGEGGSFDTAAAIFAEEVLHCRLRLCSGYDYEFLRRWARNKG